MMRLLKPQRIGSRSEAVGLGFFYLGMLTLFLALFLGRT